MNKEGAGKTAGTYKNNVGQRPPDMRRNIGQKAYFYDQKSDGSTSTLM